MLKIMLKIMLAQSTKAYPEMITVVVWAKKNIKRREL